MTSLKPTILQDTKNTLPRFTKNTLNSRTCFAKQVTHITIMPDAELSICRLGVLTNDSRSSDFQLPYLAKRFDFSYSLSASISKLNSNSVSHKIYYLCLRLLSRKRIVSVNGIP
jgi:hypothetical protein